MTGREESTYKTEHKIEEKLKKQPHILSEYYYSMTEKTAKTKLVYINYLIDYFSFLKKSGVNCNFVTSFKKTKKSTIDAYIGSCKYSDKGDKRKENGVSIIRSKIYAVKDFYNFLVDNEYIDTNPCDKVKLPKLNSDIQVTYLDKKEIKKVKQRIMKEDKYWKRDLAIFILGIRTGLRITEIIEINIEDINFEENCINVVQKGNKKRSVYFGDDTKEILLDWLAERGKRDTNAFFVSNRGNRMSYSVPKYVLEKYANDFNKRVTCHKMRSTCATTSYDATGDIYLTADVLGHTNIQNTKRYTRVSETNKRKVAGILDKI